MLNNNNNLRNEGTNFNDYFSLNQSGQLICSVPLNIDTLNADTINADQENINNRTDYNITGFLHATGDIIANYGQPNEFSLTDVGEAIQNLDISKTQNLTAVSRISQFDGKLNIQGTQPSKFISADPDGLNNYGFPELKVGRNVGGGVFTDYLVSEFCNTGTINSQNINNTNKINTNSSLNIGTTGTSGIMTLKHSNGNNIFAVSDLGVSAPTLNASFKSVLVKGGAFRTENETGQTVLNIDTSGNITANNIIFSPTDAQINGYTASLGALSAQSLNISADKTIINNNGLTTKTNLSVSGVSYLNNLNVSSTSIFNNAVSCLSSLNVSGSSNFESLNLTGSIYGEGNLQILGEISADGLINAYGGLNVSGTTTLNGDLVVNGSTITANSQINVYNYVEITQNPASSIPALKINQGQGSGAIMEILDTDSNIKLSVNQDCDINLNNVFTVDSLTGDIGAGGGNFTGNVNIGTGANKIVLHQNTKIIDCVDIHTGTFPSGLNTAITGKFNQPIGTTGQYIRGDGSLNTFPTLGGMASLNIVNNKTIYVSANTGNDANNGQSEQNAVATITQAVNLVDGSGWQVAVFPGTYNEAVNISKLNLSILGVNRESGGLINCPNTWTISNASSSVRLYGFSISNVNHTSAGALYIEGCKINSALNSSGSGYLQVYNSDLQGSSLTGQVNITGSNIKVIANGSACGILTVNNASAQVSLNNLLTSSPITLTNGVLGIGNSVVYSSGSTSNAITATAGVLILDNVSTLTPLGGVARIGISSGVSYSIRGCVIDRANSSILGTSTNQEKLFDRLRATSGRIDGTLNINNMSYGSDSATSGSVLDYSGASSSIILPKGTTGQQPSPVGGMLRYNTTTNEFEGASGVGPTWQALGGSGSGPSWTSQTDTYNIPSSYLATPTFYAPQVATTMRLQCITNTYAIYQNASNNTCYVYTINGSNILTYASSFTTDYNTNRIVASGNMIVVCSFDFTANATIKAYTYSAGTVSLTSTIASYLSQPGYVLLWSPDIVNISGNTFMVAFGLFFQSTGVSSINAYYYNGASWALMANGFPQLGASNPQTDCLRIIWNSTANLYQIIYYYVSSPTSTLRTWTININTPPALASTSPTQTISFNNGSPSGFNSYQFSQANYDGSTASLPYIHITVGSSDSPTNSGGGVQSFRWNGSTWVSALVWQMSSYVSLSANELAGYLNNSFNNSMYSTLSYSSQAFGNNLLIASQLAVIYQFTMTKSASAPFLVINYNNQLLPYGTKQASTKSMSWGLMPNGNLILTQRPDGNFNLVSFPIGSGSTVNVQYFETVNNIRESNRLAVKAGGGILEMGITTAGQLPQTGTYTNGTIYFDGDSLWILIQGTWRRFTVS